MDGMTQINSRICRFWARLGAQGVLGKSVTDLADEENDFYVVSADLGVASGFSNLMEKHKEMYVDVGIAEQNLISVAAGLTESGKWVYATTWAPFATYRCADQIRTYLGFMKKKITLVGMASGLHIAKFGSSHYGIGDISVVRSIPNIAILAPSDGRSIYELVRNSYNYDSSVYIRLTGGDLLPIIYDDAEYKFEVGKSNILRNGTDIIILGCGVILKQVLEVAERLNENGISATVVDMYSIKPLDITVFENIDKYKGVYTVEEHNVIGGLGSAVAEQLARMPKAPALEIIGIEDFFPVAGDYEYLLKQCSLTADDIYTKIVSKMQE